MADYVAQDVDDDTYDYVDEGDYENPISFSDRQTLGSFKNIRSVWNIIYLLGYLSLGVFCLGHIFVHRKKFKVKMKTL